MTYDDFIKSKVRLHEAAGFEPVKLNKHLFDWQKHVVTWAVKRGRAALFEDCGLGKTLQQLEWARQVARLDKGPVLVLAPLSVADQTEEEASKFWIKAKHIRDRSEVIEGINITNYDRLELFQDVKFAGVVLDESSILKNFTGKTRIALTERFADTPYRLCCTATPAPNDYTELGQHASFLGICTPAQMLATYFINDTFNTGDWRLKEYAKDDFWRWLGSWAACISKPSDIGFSDEGYDLPKLNMHSICVEVDQRAVDGEELFKHVTLSATTMHKELRETAADRSNAVAKLVNESDEQWLVFCETDNEADLLKARIPGATEIRGSHKPEKKEEALRDFRHGTIRVMISKPSIFGLGVNLQNCRNVIFVGLSYSFEKLYQSLRRVYRFGQLREVNAYIVQAETEGAIMANISRKIKQHAEMLQSMKQAAKSLLTQKSVVSINADIETSEGENWKMHHGDCVRVAKELPNNSIDLSVFSPPFASLFTYSADIQDMGNCANKDDFAKQFKFLIKELHRITRPGRMACVHCRDLLSTKWKDGKIEFQDFSGDIVRGFREEGWKFHSRITIWKDPVTEMQRTKAHGLLYKTLCADSTDSRMGSPDYLLVFRKDGDNVFPVKHRPIDFPLDRWQEWASPVWTTIDQGNVINGIVEDERTERHICPLQFDIIERAVYMWSNENDLVFSPFAGVGSEGVQSLKMGRKFIGSELKEAYYNQACEFLANATAQKEMVLA